MQHTHSIKKYRLHLLALGDVGGTLLLGLRLLGGDILSLFMFLLAQSVDHPPLCCRTDW